MHNLEQGNCLRPFCEFAYATMNITKADERYQKYDAAKYSSPEYSTSKIIADQILSLETTVGS